MLWDEKKFTNKIVSIICGECVRPISVQMSILICKLFKMNGFVATKIKRLYILIQYVFEF